ncbi:MAG: hypothetical protein WA461_06515 [Nitrososphaeraceae archaeon]
MMKKQIHFTKNKEPFSEFVPGIKRYISYTYSPQSIGALCHAIEKNEDGKKAGLGRLDGYPRITRPTVRRHLKKLVEQQVLIKLPEVPNSSPYKIHPNMLYLYSDYLLTLLTRGKLSIGEKDRLLLRII